GRDGRDLLPRFGPCRETPGQVACDSVIPEPDKMENDLPKREVEIVHDDDRAVIIEEPAHERGDPVPPDRDAARDMACPETGGRTDIEDLAAGFPEAVHFCDGERAQVRDPVEERCSVEVLHLHLPEIGWEVRGFGFPVPDEGLAIKSQPGIGDSLVACRCERVVCYLAAADGPGTMGRADDHAIAEREDLVPDAVMDLCCHLGFSLRPVEVRPPNLAGKEGVPAEDHTGAVGDFPVPQDQRDTLLGMPGGLQDFELERTERKYVILMHGVSKCESRLVTVIDLCPAPVLEFERTAHVILVPVRLEDVGDGQFMAGGSFSIDVNVASRVDHRSSSGGCDQIGIVGEPFRNNPFEQHLVFLPSWKFTS